MGLGFINDVTYGVEGFTDKGNAHKLKQLLREAEEWRKKHGVQFETSKYILVHFTHNHNQATNAAITIGNVTIEPSNEAKYLGVIFDKELQFKTHQYIIKKGTKAVMTLSEKHPLHEWLASAMRMRTAQNPHQTNLENILQQFPQMTENIETIESYIHPPMMDAKIGIQD